jgi:hypothetical protein
MNLPYSDPSNPALPSPLFSDLTAVRADHLRANNAAIFADLDALNERLSRKEDLRATATSGGLLTLTSADVVAQQLTGTLTHTVVLPVVTTLYLGFSFIVIDSSTQNVTVNSSGGNLVKTILAGRKAAFVCSAITGTDASPWVVFDMGGDVAGPDGVTLDNLPAFGDATGKTLVDSGFSIANIIVPESFGTVANNPDTPNTEVDFGAGAHRSDDYITWIEDAAGMTKTSGAWTAGTNNGMLDAGSFAASKTYYLYRIWKPSTSSVDYLMSLSASSPTMPALFTKKRLIGAMLSDASTHFLQGFFTRPTPTMFQCRYLNFQPNRPWAVSGSTSRVLVTLSAPVNALALCAVAVMGYVTGYTEIIRIGGTFETDIVPADGTNDVRFTCLGTNQYVTQSANITALVDANGQIYFRCAGSTYTYISISTKGWQLSL